MKFLKSLNETDILFINIQTVPILDSINKDNVTKALWIDKLKYQEGDINYEEEYSKQAGAYPEFGKIVAATIGKVVDGKLKIKSFYDLDEKELLTKLNNSVKSLSAASKLTRLCGYNVINFTIPFIMARSIINGVEPTTLFDIGHLKPWEVTSLDILNFWRATSSRGATLQSICHSLNLPYATELEQQIAHQVAIQGDFEGLKCYCENRLIDTVGVFKRLRFENALELDTSVIKEEKPKGLLEKTFNSGEISKEEVIALNEKLNELPKSKQEIGKEILNIVLK